MGKKPTIGQRLRGLFRGGRWSPDACPHCGNETVRVKQWPDGKAHCFSCGAKWGHACERCGSIAMVTEHTHWEDSLDGLELKCRRCGHESAGVSGCPDAGEAMVGESVERHRSDKDETTLLYDPFDKYGGEQ